MLMQDFVIPVTLLCSVFGHIHIATIHGNIIVTLLSVPEHCEVINISVLDFAIFSLLQCIQTQWRLNKVH